MKSIFKTTSILVLLFAAMPGVVWACPNCYGAIADSEIANGLRLAMLILIAVTAVIGCGIVMFASNIKKRSRMYEKSRSAVDSSGDIIQRQGF